MSIILVSMDGRLARISGDIFYSVDQEIRNCFDAKIYHGAEAIEIVSDAEMDEIYSILGVAV